MRSTDLILLTILTWSMNEATTIYKEVLVNAATNISCIPNKDIQIQWHHIPPGGSKDQPNYVYAGGKFYVSSNKSFRLEKDSNTGPYHLIIPNAKYEDAGLYECKEDATGSRVFGSTQLTVIESSPVCRSDMKPQGYVGPSTCNLRQEDMTFTCSVSFNGIPPQMIWKNLNVSQSFSESAHKIENGRITSSLIIRADSTYDDTVFSCQSTKSAAKCSTEMIKIQYFENQRSVVEKSLGDKVNCSVKSNQILEFKWTLLHHDQHVFLMKNQTLLIQSFGLYRCVVEYRIGNVPCSAIATDVNVYNPSAVTCEPPKQRATTITTAASIVLAICVIICFGIIAFLVCKKRLSRRTRHRGGPDTL